MILENKADVQKRMVSERLRYCSQTADITSSDYEDVDSSCKIQGSCHRKKDTTDTAKRNVAVTIAEKVVESYKQSCFLNERPYITDSCTNQRNIPNDIQREDDRNERDAADSDDCDVSNISGNEDIRLRKVQHVKRRLFTQNKLVSDSDNGTLNYKNDAILREPKRIQKRKFVDYNEQRKCYVIPIAYPGKKFYIPYNRV
ncbi:PREDICTED: uncharacterized protein LOC105564658 [Vollenhovia emeryi]|uniref:uncharacterized protein LOC105564658 n=1 Tax=Vollenhovia emeryi TaxID=411798 RepID=UPI0005F4C54D|nr:PREDICTED: uncharacterized protein LOC105564658 [Vollenhovia emeryi]